MHDEILRRAATGATPGTPSQPPPPTPPPRFNRFALSKQRQFGVHLVASLVAPFRILAHKP